MRPVLEDVQFCGDAGLAQRQIEQDAVPRREAPKVPTVLPFPDSTEVERLYPVAIVKAFSWV